MKFNPVTGNLEVVVDLSGYVPYSGATTDVDLGAHSLTSDAVQFNIGATPRTNAEGLLQWNATDGTLDLGMSGGDITQQIGQELFAKVRNDSGGTISNGQVVYISGRTGIYPDVKLAISNVESTSRVLGVATQDILDTGNKFGFVTTFGYVRGIKTNYSGSGDWGTTWKTGDLLYVSKTVAGQLTNIEPSAPHHSDKVASVGVVSANGSILINIERHKTLEELTDVDGTALTTSGQIPVWNQELGYFDFNYNLVTGYVPYSGTIDNKKIYLGTANDGSIYYNATDLIINPKEVGSGKLRVLGQGSYEGNNGNAAYTLLNLINTHETLSGQLLQTSDLVFSLTGFDGDSNIVIASSKISSYKTNDWFTSGGGLADFDSGLKFYTADNGALVLALTIDNAKLAAFAGTIECATINSPTGGSNSMSMTASSLTLTTGSTQTTFNVYQGISCNNPISGSAFKTNNSVASAGKFLRSDGSNGFVDSTLILPNAIADTYIPVATAANTISSDAGLTYNISTDVLTVTSSVTISGGSVTTAGLLLTGKIGMTGIVGAATAQGSLIALATGAGGNTTSTGTTGGEGGSLIHTAGAGGTALISGSANPNQGGAGGKVNFLTGAGGNAGRVSGGSNINVAGNGGEFKVVTGDGGALIMSGSPTAAGIGGAIILTSGNGGANSLVGASGGGGGPFTLTSGNGGTHSGANCSGGPGGAFNLQSGTGGAISNATGTSLAGQGGSMTLSAGPGGSASCNSGTVTGGLGGNYSLTSGAGGALSAGALGTAGTAGTGGSIFLTASNGQATNGIFTVSVTSGKGGSITIKAGNAGASSAGSAPSKIGANGGTITITAGDATATAGAAAIGGDIIIDSGAGSPSGTQGNIKLGITRGNIWNGIDNTLSLWGTGQDASITYDGTDFIFNPILVGTGLFRINTLFQADCTNGNIGVGLAPPTAASTAAQMYLYPSETHGTVMRVAGTAVPYTGTYQYVTVFDFQRTITRTQNNPPLHATQALLFSVSDGTIYTGAATAFSAGHKGLVVGFSNTSNHTVTSNFIAGTFNNVGIESAATFGGILATTNVTTATNKGINTQITDSHRITTSGQTLDCNTYGIFNSVNCSGVASGGATLNRSVYGEWIVPSIGASSAILYEGIHLVAPTNATTMRGIVLAGDGNGSDIYFGAGFDAKINYDGTNWIFDTSLVGASDLKLTCGANKTIELQNSVWKDVFFPQGVTKATGSGNPTFTTMTGNIKGYSYAVNDAYDGDPQEFPHDGKQGVTTGSWHIHWVNTTNVAATRGVKWQIEYEVRNIGSDFTTTTTISAEETVPANTPVGRHFLTAIGTFTTPNIGAMVVARITRIAAAGTAPANNPFVLGCHFHYEVDTVGSRQIATK